jgi:hypothetical protein
MVVLRRQRGARSAFLQSLTSTIGYDNATIVGLTYRGFSGCRPRTGVGLPCRFANRKTVDPADSASTRVIQFQTAIGAAHGSIPDARVQLLRRRFTAVKTDDLLVVRSDAYQLASAPSPRNDRRGGACRFQGRAARARTASLVGSLYAQRAWQKSCCGCG